MGCVHSTGVAPAPGVGVDVGASSSESPEVAHGDDPVESEITAAAPTPSPQDAEHGRSGLSEAAATMRVQEAVAESSAPRLGQATKGETVDPSPSHSTDDVGSAAAAAGGRAGAPRTGDSSTDKAAAGRRLPPTSRRFKSRAVLSEEDADPLVFDTQSRLWIPSRKHLPPSASMRHMEAPSEERQALLRTQSKLEVVQDEAGRKIVNQYALFEIVGRGAFGKVRRCVSINSGNTYAAKVMRKSALKRRRVGRFSTALAHAQREVALWKKMRHPHLVSLHDVIDDPQQDRLYLVSDFVNGGSLLPLAPKQTTWPALQPHVVQYFAGQLFAALAYLHSCGIAHRDIKPENILVQAQTSTAAVIRPWAQVLAPPVAPVVATPHAESGECDSSDSEEFRATAPVVRLSMRTQQKLDDAAPGKLAAAVLRSQAGEGADPPTVAAEAAAGAGMAGTPPRQPGPMAAPPLTAFTLKLADFGLAQVFDDGDDRTRSTAGTAAFVAPEMVSEAGRKEGFSATKADMWAVGVTLYMVLFGRMPFVGDTLPALYEAVQGTEPPMPPASFSGPPPLPEALDLLRALLQKDPALRPNADECVRHAFVGGAQGAAAVAGTAVQVTEEEVATAITPLVTIRGVVKAKVATGAILRKVRHRLSQAFTSSSSSSAEIPPEEVQRL